jgi:hypothetical protein
MSRHAVIVFLCKSVLPETAAGTIGGLSGTDKVDRSRKDVRGAFSIL